MSLIKLTVIEIDTIVLGTPAVQQFDPLRVKRVEAKGTDSLVHYYDPKQSRTVEYLVDETDIQIAALVSSLRFENTLKVDATPLDADSNRVVLYQEDLAHISSYITKRGDKRVIYNMGDENNQLNREIDMGSEIITADSGTKTFTVVGDQTKVYKDGDTINVNGSPDNDQAFTIDGDSTVNGDGNTEIVVVEVTTDNEGGFITVD